MKSPSALSAALPCPTSGPTSLKEFTTLKTGGACSLFAEPGNSEEAAASLALLRREQVPVRFLGGGSNLLIPDEGFDGCVVSTGRMKTLRRDGERLWVGAGVSLPGLIHDAAEAGLSGLEGFVGIPGSVGGAVRMNSGGRYGEFWERVEEVEVSGPDGLVRAWARADARPSYRDGGLGDLLCLAAVLRLEQGEPSKIRVKTATVLAEKAAAQPLTERSAGCIFKNPKGRSAGRLVEEAGCKGWREGGAFVSEKHGNFLVNRGGATAAQVRRLIERVREAVEQSCGIRLDLEIVLW